MGLVDYTALVPATGFTDTFPICQATPVDGIKKDFWRKVRVDFTLTGLADASQATIMQIPAHTYIFEVMTVIVAGNTAAAGLTVSDESGDHGNAWVTTQVAQTANTALITPGSTNGLTKGKYYHAAGALYCSGTANFAQLILDVYVHCMTIDPA